MRIKPFRITETITIWLGQWSPATIHAPNGEMRNNRHYGVSFGVCFIGLTVQEDAEPRETNVEFEDSERTVFLLIPGSIQRLHTEPRLWVTTYNAGPSGRWCYASPTHSNHDLGPGDRRPRWTDAERQDIDRYRKAKANGE
jgi:hypothetical protein